MNKFFLALVCAAMVFLGALSVSAGEAITYTCDAFARTRTGDKFVRREWQRIVTAPGIVRERNKDVTVLVAISGDPHLDQTFRSVATMTRGPFDGRGVIKNLEWMVAVHVRELAHIIDGESRAVCWQSGTTPPDRSAWPSAYTCRGAVYYRVFVDDEPSNVVEKVIERSGLSGPYSSAHGELYKILIEAANAAAYRFALGQGRMVLDNAQGSGEATPIACWTSKKPSAPDGWRGPTSW